MKRIMQVKNKVTFLLLFAILVLCIGFIFIACGVDPATKGINNNTGQYALNYLDCPSGRACSFSVKTTDNSYARNSIEGKPLTMEAWIKPTVTSTAYFLKHLESRGIGLKTVAIHASSSCNNAATTVFSYSAAHEAVIGQALVTATSVGACGITADTPYYVCSVPDAFTLTLADSIDCLTPVGSQAGGGAVVDWSDLDSKVAPMFEIRRVVASANPAGATSSVSYKVAGTPIALNTWTHVAGVLTDDTHAVGMLIGVPPYQAAHPACAASPGDGDATDDAWHMDIYLNGVITACVPTYGGNTDYTGGAEAEVDPTAAADAYAHAPGAKTIAVFASGIIDETRIWTTERTISTCMSVELGTSGTCDRTDDTLLSYLRFNAGSGYIVMDEAGIMGSAVKQYIDTSEPSGFANWITGWTTDTPF